MFQRCLNIRPHQPWVFPNKDQRADDEDAWESSSTSSDDSASNHPDPSTGPSLVGAPAPAEAEAVPVAPPAPSPSPAPNPPAPSPSPAPSPPAPSPPAPSPPAPSPPSNPTPGDNTSTEATVVSSVLSQFPVCIIWYLEDSSFFRSRVEKLKFPIVNFQALTAW